MARSALALAASAAAFLAAPAGAQKQLTHGVAPPAGTPKLQHVQQLWHANGSELESFGGRIEISGDLLILGSDQYHDVADEGGALAWIFERDPSDGLFKETTRIELPVAVDEDYRLGQWVNVDDATKTAIVGAPRTFLSPGEEGSLVGVAVVFEKDADGAFAQTAILTSDVAAAGSRFGLAVDIHNGTALVGAPYMYCEDGAAGFNETWVDTVFYDPINLDYPTAEEWAEGAQLCGAVFVFEQDENGEWSQTAKLTTSDIEPGDRLGFGVKLYGDRAIIVSAGEDSNRGAAYVFERGADGEWAEQQKFQAAYNLEGQRLSHFGEHLDLDDLGGETMMFGTPWINTSHIFTKQGTAWPEVATPIRSDGSSVSISGDFALFDGWYTYHDDTPWESAHLYHRSCGNWSLVATLEVPQDLQGDPQSMRRAMISGDTAVIAIPTATHEGTADHGTAFIYDLPSLVNECAECEADETALTAELAAAQAAAYAASATSGPVPDVTGDQLLHDDREANDNFGVATAVSGDYAAIGGRGKDDSTGAAWIFERQLSGQWQEVTRLQPVEAQSGDEFGLTVAVSGDTALVGAPYSHFSATIADSGIVYAYARDPLTGAWSQTAVLRPDDPTPGALFGWGLSIDGNTAVIGAAAHACEGFLYEEGEDADGQDCGAAYVFERSNVTGAWEQTAKLTPAPRFDYSPPDKTMDELVAGDSFGFSTAISGDTAMVVSAFHRDGRGAVYVFDRMPDGGWLETDKLLQAYDEPGGGFAEVALDGDTAVVVSRSTDDDSGSVGSGVIFVRVGGTWSEQALLVPIDAAPGQRVVSAALYDDLVVLGAPALANATAESNTYAFHRSCGIWTQVATMSVPDGEDDGNFGRSVAASGTAGEFFVPLMYLLPRGIGSSHRCSRSFSPAPLTYLAPSLSYAPPRACGTVMIGAPNTTTSIIDENGNSTTLEAHGAAYSFILAGWLPPDACASDCDSSTAASVPVVSARTTEECAARLAELQCDLAALA